MERTRDDLLIVNRVGLIRLAPAGLCLFFGLPALAVLVTSIVQGRLVQDWQVSLVALVIGVPLTYFGLGFLTFAHCTRLDRSTRSGETWTRLIHRWQNRAFRLSDRSVITVRTPFDTRVVRYRAMLKTTGEAVQLYEHRNRERVEQQARQAGLFMGIPVLLDEKSGTMPLEVGEFEAGEIEAGGFGEEEPGDGNER